MKKVIKGKNAQPPKGNLKISSFFQKKVTVETKNASSPRKTAAVDNFIKQTSVKLKEADDKAVNKSAVIVIDSDNSEDTETGQKCKKCKRNIEISASCSYDSESDFIDSNEPSTSSKKNLTVDVVCRICNKKRKKKRRSSSISDDKSIPEAKRKSADVSDDVDNVQSEVSVDFLQLVTVQTPEKLFPKEVNHPTVSNLSIDQIEPENHSNPVALNSLSNKKVSKAQTPQKPSEISCSSKTKVKSPSDKYIPLKNHDINVLEDKSKKTPCKTPKKSPRLKLFDRSPRKLDEFNVQIIDNFVKMTPSKSNNKEMDTLKSPGSSAKKQASILNYISPISHSSREAQKINETTPKKSSPVHKQFVSPPVGSKAKAKLDFSSCPLPNTADKKENNKEMLPDINFANLDNAFNDDNWDITFSVSPDEYILNLEEPKHCKVLESIEKRNRITVKVKSTISEEKAICHLDGFWINTRLKAGDIIYINAIKDAEGNWLINNDAGLLVYEPDLLISSTSVVRSVFCMRRSVLTEKYQGFEPANQIMVIGILVHTLLQSVLKNNVQTTSGIEKVINEIISSNSAIRKMYEASLTLEDVRNELLKFVPRIVDFIKQYVQKDTPQMNINCKNVQNKPWNGKIDSIDDIEENIWCPQLGIKGKVDVSIRSKDNIYPLELKTGRASMSLEHKGQVILYVMMMNTLGYKISSGLLHYLKEGLLTEINLNTQESRDLIILRNELTYFLTAVSKANLESLESDQEGGNSSKNNPFGVLLPEPIDHLNGCKKCPYNIICAGHIPYESHDLSLKKNFLAIQKDCLLHLQKHHLDYFIHWSLLLSLENISKKDSKPLRQIYTLPPNERAKLGRCISNIRVVKTEIKSDTLIEHTFAKSDDHTIVNFLASGIMENNYIVVSTDNRPAVVSGFVTDITTNSITVSLERDLNKKYRESLFHLDTYDSAASTNFNMTSLALLLEDSPRSEHLRKIIIDKEPPTFLQKLPKIVAIKSVPILKRLNKSQQRAVLKSLSAKDYLLIKGMPGTGKTATIVALVQLLVEVNKTVLITSHTHSAIDNMCIRLKKFGVNVLRLGSITRLDEKVKLSSEYSLTKNCKSPEEIEKIYNEAQVVAVTCLGSGHPLLSKRVFDICLVDESTQVLQTSIFRPLHCAKTFILIGDPDQLAPVVKNKEALKRGMSESLFERLNSPEAYVTLNQNYRMNKTITALANSLTYSGELLIGSEMIANAHLKLPKEVSLKRDYAKELWVLEALATSLESSVQIIDTNLENVEIDPKQGGDKGNCLNVHEAVVVVKLVNVLLEAGVSREDIGVIATYRDQVAYISRILSDVDVSTVDQFQGKDKNVIIYSCTKFRSLDTPISEFNLLEDHRRLTVAITRAKHKLIIIGELKVVGQHKPFAKLLSSLDASKFLRLEEGNMGFSWKILLEKYAEVVETK